MVERTCKTGKSFGGSNW